MEITMPEYCQRLYPVRCSFMKKRRGWSDVFLHHVKAEYSMSKHFTLQRTKADLMSLTNKEGIFKIKLLRRVFRRLGSRRDVYYTHIVVYIKLKIAIFY
jgi:hypothetical protein